MTVIFFLIAIIGFIAVDVYLQRAKSLKTAPVVKTVIAPAQPIRVPAGIFFASSHTWFNLFPSGKVRMGIDDFVLRMLQRPEITFLKSSDAPVSKGEPLFELRDGTHMLTVRSPLDGTIVGRNEQLLKDPSLMKQMLYSDGWALTIKPNRLSDVAMMMLGENSRRWLQQELSRLRDFIAGTAGNPAMATSLLQDGGIPVEGALINMDDVQWKKFEQQFLIEH
jgi:glycine cleavage system H lipoate-binding protein